MSYLEKRAARQKQNKQLQNGDVSSTTTSVTTAPRSDIYLSQGAQNPMAKNSEVGERDCKEFQEGGKESQTANKDSGKNSKGLEQKSSDRKRAAQHRDKKARDKKFDDWIAQFQSRFREYQAIAGVTNEDLARNAVILSSSEDASSEFERSRTSYLVRRKSKGAEDAAYSVFLRLQNAIYKCKNLKTKHKAPLLENLAAMKIMYADMKDEKQKLDRDKKTYKRRKSSLFKQSRKQLPVLRHNPQADNPHERLAEELLQAEAGTCTPYPLPLRLFLQHERVAWRWVVDGNEHWADEVGGTGPIDPLTVCTSAEENEQTEKQHQMVSDDDSGDAD